MFCFSSSLPAVATVDHNVARVSWERKILVTTDQVLSAHGHLKYQEVAVPSTKYQEKKDTSYHRPSTFCTRSPEISRRYGSILVNKIWIDIDQQDINKISRRPSSKYQAGTKYFFLKIATFLQLF